MVLEEYGESLAYEIAFWMGGLEDPSYPIEEIGRMSLEISDKFRALGIIALLVYGNHNLFLHNLMRSGLARVTYLSRIRNAKATRDHHYASGRFAPLLDAIASGDFSIARRITQGSPDRWQSGKEYEDDFCYARLLGGLVEEPVAEARATEKLERRYLSALEGEADSRLDVCRALVARDQKGFDMSFAALLEARSDQIAADKARAQLEDPVVIAQRRIFVEGLAILRIADSIGLATEADYEYCPALARQPLTIPFPGE